MIGVAGRERVGAMLGFAEVDLYDGGFCTAH